VEILQLVHQEVKQQAEVPQQVEEQPQQVEIPQLVHQEVRQQAEAHEAQMEAQNLGTIFLKAADYLLGGTHYFIQEIKRHFSQERADILAKTEALIYTPLLSSSEEGLSSYLNELQQVSTLVPDFFNIISDIFLDISGIKVILSNGSAFYSDGQLYTVWSSPYMPSDFSSTIYNIKGYINRCFKEDEPFVLFMAPGYDMPTKEFFDFMTSLEGIEKSITSLTLYGDKLREIEVIEVAQNRRRYFIFGLWPWQFIDFRKVKKIGEFRPFRFEALKLDFYLADAELELSQPNVNKVVTLRGAALKGSLNEKIRLLVLSNLTAEKATAEQIANLYLRHWPNLEEAFRDYSRKIELFTYTANSRRFLSTESLAFAKGSPQSIKAVFEYYLKALDYYVRWHFLPTGYENKDFSTVNEQFYSLKASLNKQRELILVTPQLPSGYPFLKDLEYALRRLNEREILFTGAKRLFLNVAS
jgi:hypothetical protein